MSWGKIALVFMMAESLFFVWATLSVPWEPEAWKDQANAGRGEGR